MGVVIDLDPLGPRIQPERLADVIEDLGLGRVLGQLAAQRLAGVGQGVADQVGLLAPARNGDLHPALRLHGEGLGQQLDLVRRDIGQDQARDRLVFIELPQEGAEDLRVAVAAVDAGEIGPPAPVLARAEEEGLDARLTAVGEQGEDVGLLHGLGVDRLLHGDGRQRPDAVPHPRRALEVQIVRGRLHLARQPADHRPRLAAQELFGRADQFAIVLQADQAGARRRASLDLVQHAGADAAFVDAVGAGPEKERLLQGVQRAVHRPGGGEGAEIVARHGVGAPVLADLGRAVVAADHQLGERLVVAQHHIEARLQLLDEVGFQQQGLGLRGRDHHLHGPGQGHHQGDALGVEPPLGVLHNALLQGPRLAHVQAGPVLAIHAIDARLVRRAPRLVADQLGGGQRGFRGRFDGRGFGHGANIGAPRLPAKRLSPCGPAERRRSAWPPPPDGSG